MENEQENAEALVQQETAAEGQQEAAGTSDQQDAQVTEDAEALKAELAKAKEIAENQRIRAEKAERKAKEQPKEAPKAQEGLSARDIYAFVEAKVPQDDIDDVVEYARLKGISPAEALKTSVVKAILTDKAEHRRSAEATNTGTARRGTHRVADDILLKKAESGELPDDPSDLERLVKLRKGFK